MQVPKITIGAWVRTIALLIALINGVLLMLGYQPLPIGEDEINHVVNIGYSLFSAIAVVAASLAAWWKNNNFTVKARQRDEKIKELEKNGEL